MVYCKNIRGTPKNSFRGSLIRDPFSWQYTIYIEPKNIRNVIYVLIKIHEASSTVRNLLFLSLWTLNYQSKHHTLSVFSYFWPWPCKSFLFYMFLCRKYTYQPHILLFWPYVCHTKLCAKMEASKLVKPALSILWLERTLFTNERLHKRPICIITRVCPFYLLVL